MAAMNSIKSKEKAKGNEKGMDKGKGRAKGKEKEAVKQPMQCRFLCRHPSHIERWTPRKPRCAFRGGHEDMTACCNFARTGIGMSHVCEEHLFIAIDGFRLDAGGKIMVPRTLVSKLRAPLDPTVYVTDHSNDSCAYSHWPQQWLSMSPQSTAMTAMHICNEPTIQSLSPVDQRKTTTCTSVILLACQSIVSIHGSLLNSC